MKPPRKPKQAVKDDQEASPASAMQQDDEQLTLFAPPKSAPGKRALLSDFDAWKNLCDELAGDAQSPSLFPQPSFCTPETAKRIKKDLVRLTKRRKHT